MAQLPPQPDSDKPADPFDRRPTIIFQAKQTELATWAMLSAGAITGACVFLAAMSVQLDRKHFAPAAACLIGAIVLADLWRNSILNSPSSMGLNIDTRRYKLIKGAGRFKRTTEGTFDDIVGVGWYVVESSRGVDGYNVAVYFKGKSGRCDIERHSPSAKALARDRAEQLARLLSVNSLAPTP